MLGIAIKKKKSLEYLHLENYNNTKFTRVCVSTRVYSIWIEGCKWILFETVVNVHVHVHGDMVSHTF